MLIRDLLVYFRPANVFDPMAGSATCADVCRKLGVPCTSGDVDGGFDLCDARQFSGPNRRIAPGSFDLVCIRPPYSRQNLYAVDSRDLSRTPTLEAFLDRYVAAIATAPPPSSPVAVWPS